MKNEKIKSVVEEKFLKPGFSYWFANHGHIRTPFPKPIQNELSENATGIFMEWVNGLNENALKTLSDNEFAEMFETILFNEGIKLVEDEDQRLTILYPFMPRIGDLVNHKEFGSGKIVERSEITGSDKKKMIGIKVKPENGLEIWETKFELTA